MNRYLFVIFSLVVITSAKGQHPNFIERGNVRYETTRSGKTMSTGEQTESSVSDIFEFTFQKERTFYFQPGKDRQKWVYREFSKHKVYTYKIIYDEAYYFSSPWNEIKWKISDSVREILGFKCRQAVGIIPNTTTQVIAYFAPEIISNAGPEYFCDLPGLILSIEIPAWKKSIIAKSLTADTVSSKVFPEMSKVKVYESSELAELVIKRNKDSLDPAVTADLILRAFIKNFSN